MNALDYFTPPPVRLDELYHTNSKHAPGQLTLATGVQKERRERRMSRLYAASQGRYKTYDAFDSVALPRVVVPLGSLDDAIATRRSYREFGPGSLTIEQIATLLLRSYGTSGAARAVPSGGGLYPLDLYLLQPGAGTLAEGVYHYHVGRHALQPVVRECPRATLAAASIYPDIIDGAATLLAVVADMKRTRIKYGERAYRLALLEAGHVSQNLYLVAGALGLGLIVLDGFYDDQVHAILDLDGVSEIALMLFAIGKRR